MFSCTLGSTLFNMHLFDFPYASSPSCSCWFSLRKGAILSTLGYKLRTGCNEIRLEFVMFVMSRCHTSRSGCEIRLPQKRVRDPGRVFFFFVKPVNGHDFAMMDGFLLFCRCKVNSFVDFIFSPQIHTRLVVLLL